MVYSEMEGVVAFEQSEAFVTFRIMFTYFYITISVHLHGITDSINVFVFPHNTQNRRRLKRNVF